MRIAKGGFSHHWLFAQGGGCKTFASPPLWPQSTSLGAHTVMLPRINIRGFCRSRSPISHPSRASHNAEFLLHRPSDGVASTDFTTVHSTAKFNEQHSRSKMLLAWFSPRANRRGQELDRSQFYARRLNAQPTTETFKDPDKKCI